jgi:hypothetical protein
VKKLSIFLITVALIAGMAGCGGGDGDGYNPLPSQNLEIRDWYDLNAVRNNLGGNHTLMNDLDSTTAGYEELASPTANQGKGWQPIGTWLPYSLGGFWGTFDGQGHEIRDLFINRPDESDVGLFGVVDGGWDGGGVIKDIGVVNVTVTGGEAVGSLAGGNHGTVSDSYSSGSVTGDGGVGGLMGSSTGTVSNSYSSGNVIGNSSVGGLVGWNEGTVSNSHFTGTVTSEGSYVGGLVGLNWYGTVTDSYSTSSVTGKDGVGGLVGQNDGAKGTGEGTVSDSYSSGSVTGEDGVGGLVGENQGEGTVSNSYYNYDEVLINGESMITIGALFGEAFDQWLDNNKFLDINERLSQENGYYLINDVRDFKDLLAFGQNDSLKFRLTNDLDLGDEPNFYIPYLAGEFDGNGHKISNLSFNFDFVYNVGLFGYLAPGGKVSQVGVESVNITGASFVGGLVGATWGGTVSDSYSSGTVTGNEDVGGLVGHNRGTVSDSYTTGSVTGNWRVGGLMGLNVGPVDSSYSTGSVTGSDQVGGLVGSNWGTVSNSYSTGNVIGSCYVGGLMGYSRGWDTVSNSYSTGNVIGDEYVGGLVGSNGDRVTVSNCYSTGSVNGDEHVGGLVGDNEGEGIVSNSFWDTETSGQSTSDGGTGKTTAEMQDIATFSEAAWDITAVANPGTRNPSYIWNIIDKQTYPFLNWES